MRARTLLVGLLALASFSGAAATAEPVSAAKPVKFWVDHSWNGAVCASDVTFTYHWETTPKNAAEARLVWGNPGVMGEVTTSALGTGSVSITVTLAELQAANRGYDFVATGYLSTERDRVIGRSAASDPNYFACPIT